MVMDGFTERETKLHVATTKQGVTGPGQGALQSVIMCDHATARMWLS